MTLGGFRAELGVPRTNLPRWAPFKWLDWTVRHLDLSGVESDTTKSKGLYPRGSQRVHSLCRRRRRGSDPAPAGETATTALRLYGAVATAYPFAGVPLRLR